LAFNGNRFQTIGRNSRLLLGYPLLAAPSLSYSTLWSPTRAQERRDDFLQETMARLVDLQALHDGLSAEALRNNEQFQATMLQAARLATAIVRADLDEVLLAEGPFGL
jgi:hypothetical protein